MVADLTFLKESFTRFNRLIFGNELPEPKFSLTKARTFHGKLLYRWRNTWRGKEFYDFEIRLSTTFDFEKHIWEDVVIHEMIHYHIAWHKLRDTSSHGAKFRQMMADINRRFGRNISVAMAVGKEQKDADRQVRAHYLCIARFDSGRYGVAPMARSRMPELWEIFRPGSRPSGFAGVTIVGWFGVLDPWFNRFPRVMKPKLYFVGRDELLPHLKGAKKLEVDGVNLHATDLPQDFTI